jgi:hypothetical protein
MKPKALFVLSAALVFYLAIKLKQRPDVAPEAGLFV